MTEQTGVADGYGGYEYQIEVSVWAALDLLLVRRCCDEIEIEARSKEDIEADLQRGPSQLTFAASKLRLTIQVKSRSTGPWKSSSFIEVLRGDEIREDEPLTTPATKRGPAPRTRPLEILAQDPDRLYLFITDAAVERSLHPYIVSEVGDPSEAKTLPGHLGRGMTEIQKQDIAKRITIMEKATSEVIKHRTRQHLFIHGRVPQQNIDGCLTELIGNIRDKLLNRSSDNVLRYNALVGILNRYGRRATISGHLETFVEPKSFQAILRSIEKHHAVIITGPSGTGKTMTADVIEGRLLAHRAFTVVGKGNGPEQVRHALNQPGPFLFHLRDPWGETRYSPSARPWSAELPKLIKHAGPDKIFLVTTRSDVAYEAEMEGVSNYTIAVEPKDYNKASRAMIYDNHATALKGTRKRFAMASRNEVLSVLEKPFEIERFIDAVSVETGELKSRPLLERSQLKAISQVVKKQITDAEDKKDYVNGATITWALIAGCGALSLDLVPTLRRSLTNLGSPAKLEAFVNLMVEARNLRNHRGDITFHHPQIAKGFLLAMQSEPNEAENVLASLIQTLLSLEDDQAKSAWGAETANRFRSLLIDETVDLSPSLSEQTINKLDRHLIDAALDATNGRFTRYIRELATLGGASSTPARFARCLLRERRPKSQASSPSWTGYLWSLPEGAMADVTHFANDTSTVALAKRFVSDGMVESSVMYGTDIVEFLLAVCPSLPDIALQRLIEIVPSPNSFNNLRAMIQLALRADIPPIDDVIDLFLRLEDTLDASYDAEQSRRASQGVLDAFDADHLFEARDEAYSVVNEGLRTCIAWLRVHNPDTLRSHSHQPRLLGHWIETCKQEVYCRSVPVEEIEYLLRSARSSDEIEHVWGVARTWRPAEMAPRLINEIENGHLDAAGVRRARLEALSTILGASFYVTVHEINSRVPVAAQLTLIQDYLQLGIGREARGGTKEVVLTKLLEPLPARLHYLALRIRQLERERVGRQEEIDPEQFVSAASVLAFDEFGALATDMRARIIEAVPNRAWPIEVINALLGTDDPEIMERAIKALEFSSQPGVHERLEDYLHHLDYRVRRAAMLALAPYADEILQRQLANLGIRDESAMVRLAFVRMIRVKKWPDKLPALGMLVSDGRDFNSQSDYETGVTFEVAREAIIALDEVSDNAHEVRGPLVRLLQRGSRDRELTPLALNALRKIAQTANEAWLMDALRHGLAGLERADAAWELIKRAHLPILADHADFVALLAEILSIDEQELQIPVAIFAAISGDVAVADMAWDRLNGEAHAKLRELMAFAAMIEGRDEARKIMRARLTIALPQDRIALALENRAQTGAEFTAVESDERSWLESLDPDETIDALLRNLAGMKDEA